MESKTIVIEERSLIDISGALCWAAELGSG